ncbi:MAG TPA: hypothetical protein VM597_14635 [Gemmataceae bacterium]|nr:hypothetical protein [Gemmataceae bacterium]
MIPSNGFSGISRARTAARKYCRARLNVRAAVASANCARKWIWNRSASAGVTSRSGTSGLKNASIRLRACSSPTSVIGFTSDRPAMYSRIKASSVVARACGPTRPTLASFRARSIDTSPSHRAVSASWGVPAIFAAFSASTRRQTSSATFIGTLPRRMDRRFLSRPTNWMVRFLFWSVEMLAMMCLQWGTAARSGAAAGMHFFTGGA